MHALPSLILTRRAASCNALHCFRLAVTYGFGVACVLSMATRVAAVTPVTGKGGNATPIPSAAAAAAPSGAGDRAQNVKVAVRIRPFNKREKGLGSSSIIEATPDRKTIQITNPKSDKPTENKSFGT